MSRKSLAWAVFLVLGLLVATGPVSGQSADDSRISLDFDEIELRQAIQFILRGRDDIRYVTGEPLREKLTVKFTDIHWRTALDSLLKAHNYTSVDEGEVLRVVRVQGAEDRGRRIPLVVRLRFANAGDLREFLKPMLSAQGQILLLGSGDQEGQIFAVVDTPEVLQTIKELLPTLDQPPRDVRGELTVHPDGSVDVHLTEYPLSSLSDLLSTKLDLNVYVSGMISGKANVHLDGVSWELAVGLILKDAGYVFRQEENGVVVISSIEETKGQLATQQFRLNFIDGWDVKPYVESLLSEQGKVACYSPSPKGGYDFGAKITEQRSRGDVDQSSLRSKVISVTDHQEILSVVAERIRALDIRPRQVEVDVKIIQITRDRSRQVGFDWNIVASLSGSNRPTVLPWGPHESRLFPSPFPNPATGFTFGSLAADQLQAIVRLIETDDDLEIVSQPNLTTLDNIEAKILIGQKFPVTRETIDPQTAVRTVTLDYYEDIGIQLVVVPSISDGDRVHMIIHPAVSSLESLVEGRFPVINTREADTQLLLRSGETAVIGGLIEKTTDPLERRVPILGRIPLLRHLFTYRSDSELTTELVILVTPRIVLEPGELNDSLLIGTKRVEVLRNLNQRFDEILED